MTKTRPNSRIEIWGNQYINYPEHREGKDQKAVIVQIERGGADKDYIVEVIDCDD